MAQGTIKKLVADKGFGFIKDNSAPRSGDRGVGVAESAICLT